MSKDGLFSGGLASEAEIEAILDKEARGSGGYAQEMGDNSPEYLAERRAILGPAADITHPEFRRPNRPTETFQLIYELAEEPAGTVLEPGKTEAKTVYRRVIREYILGHDNELISYSKLGEY